MNVGHFGGHLVASRSARRDSETPKQPIRNQHHTSEKGTSILMISIRSRWYSNCPTIIVLNLLTTFNSFTMATNTSSFVPAVEILSSRIRENSSKLSWYLQSQGQNDPSLYGVEEKSPQYIDAQSWRHQLKQDALELFRLASGPQEYMGHLSMNVGLTQHCMSRC